MTYQASGSLWQDALLMQDLQTESLWSQPSGECIKGELEGKTLTQFPAIHTTYAEFKKMYPHGVLLEKRDKGSRGSPYESYFADEKKLGMFGRVDNFRRLQGKEKVLGLKLSDAEVAVSLKYLMKNGYALLLDITPPIVVSYSTSGQTVAAFTLPMMADSATAEVTVSGGRISLADPLIVWDAATGRAVSGVGKNLAAVPIVTSYWFAWASFFPDTRLVN